MPYILRRCRVLGEVAAADGLLEGLPDTDDSL